MTLEDRFPPSKNVEFRSVWSEGSTSADEDSDTETRRITNHLLPLIEDLAVWINKHTNSNINGENFFSSIDNGYILMKLASVILEKIRIAAENGSYTGPIPHLSGRIWNKARRTFFCRDNMENFINFCRDLGIHENLLFESDDLVLHHSPRNVILCLTQLGRIGDKLQMEPPRIVRLEEEMKTEEPASPEDQHLIDCMLQNAEFIVSTWPVVEAKKTARGGSDDMPSDSTERTWSIESTEDLDVNDFLISSPTPPPSEDEERDRMTELDLKVRRATEEAQKLCQCPSSKCIRLKVRKVGEGRYYIAGRNVFIRALNGKFIMVRVGGGWDTLQNFLKRHDPCQVRKWGRDGTVEQMAPISRSMTNTPTINRAEYLHIKAKYCSPSTPKSSFAAQKSLSAAKLNPIPKSSSTPKSLSKADSKPIPKSRSAPKSLTTASKPKAAPAPKAATTRKSASTPANLSASKQRTTSTSLSASKSPTKPKSLSKNKENVSSKSTAKPSTPETLSTRKLTPSMKSPPSTPPSKTKEDSLSKLATPKSYSTSCPRLFRTLSPLPFLQKSTIPRPCSAPQ